MLVTAAVFLVILSAVYLVYTTSHTTYARGETRAEIHQTTRAALDLMVGRSGNPDKNIPNYQLTTDISPRNLGV